MQYFCRKFPVFCFSQNNSGGLIVYEVYTKGHKEYFNFLAAHTGHSTNYGTKEQQEAFYCRY